MSPQASPAERPVRMAIVGAGVAGLTLAQRLTDAGLDITVVEKSRGPGGRCATRQTPAGAFDHGPGEVQVLGDAFRAAVAALPEPAAIGLNAWARRLGIGPAGVRWTQRDQHTVAALEAAEEPAPGAPRAWMLRLAPAQPDHTGPAERLGPFDAVVVAVPAEQARTLLQPSEPLVQALRAVSSQPCWTVMVAWSGEMPALPRRVSAAPSDGPLQVARPMAGTPEGRWVLQASADWSAANLDADPASVAERLLQAFSARAGVRLARPAFSTVHRWRYSQVEGPLSMPWGWDPALALGSVGDAWAGAVAGAAGIERAWTSAQAFADAWCAGALGRPGGR